MKEVYFSRIMVWFCALEDFTVHVVKSMGVGKKWMLGRDAESSVVYSGLYPAFLTHS